MGASGADKTTLIKLLLRFYDVDSESITIDGVDLRDLSKKDLRKTIGIVPQDPVLFNESIGFNIAYAKENPTSQEIESAARIANLHDFIEKLPKSYNTLVGEREIKLSGGQKQRLAIARMFLEDPRIIIFDEATSQLDSHSEKLIQETFWKVAKNRTTVIIAHRLSTVKHANRILVLSGGKIIEEGSQDDLIRLNGKYNKLWQLQSGKEMLP